MPSKKQLRQLTESLSPTAKILGDHQSTDFKDRFLRWSDIGKQVPSAIVIPASEQDCQVVIKWASSVGVPFVPKSGGMSLYSTVGKNGVVIDLSNMTSVVHHKDRREVVLSGGVIAKEVAMELAKDGYCTTLPSSNPVGAIPFFLNGGNSPLVSKLGYGSDHIISARMITAAGDLIHVSESENPELLYAIRGAGQYFGLITSLTVRTFPNTEVFGNDQGMFWAGRFVFPVLRAGEVGRALEGIVDNDKYCIGCFVMVAAPPPDFAPVVVVTARLIDPDSDSLQSTVFKQLYDLGPLATGGDQVRTENSADALTPLAAFGDFKKLRLTGIHSYNVNSLPQLARVWQGLVEECPDAKTSVLGILFESQSTPAPPIESANGMQDIRLWANNLIWCKKVDSVDVAEKHLQKAIDVVRADDENGERVDFTNSLREPESRLEDRYKSSTLERLRSLKRKWDPEGVFTQELL